MLERALRLFTRRLAGLMNAERASVMLVDDEQQALIVRISQDEEIELRSIPIGTGIAGAAARTGETIRIDDAYADPRFNPDFDRRTGFRTRSILCLPIRNQDDEVFAVTQLLNRKDGRPFDENDETRFSDFAKSLGVILEALHRMHNENPFDRRNT